MSDFKRKKQAYNKAINKINIFFGLMPCEALEYLEYIK